MLHFRGDIVDILYPVMHEIDLPAAAQFTVDGVPGEFSGKVSVIEPKIDEATRSMKVRAIVQNGGGKLMPGAFAKIGKSLESFYDLMSAVDKVGHLIDLPTLPPSRSLDAGMGAVEVRFRSLCVQGGGRNSTKIQDIKIDSGQRYAIIGEGECGKSTLMQTLCGLRPPASGYR